MPPTFLQRVAGGAGAGHCLAVGEKIPRPSVPGQVHPSQPVNAPFIGVRKVQDAVGHRRHRHVILKTGEKYVEPLSFKPWVASQNCVAV